MPKVLSLDKSLHLLEAVFQSREGVGTRALAQQLGYNVATIHNIAMTFRDRGYIEQNSITKQFLPGARLMFLGRHPNYLQSLVTSASPIIEGLSGQLKENILLSSIDHEKNTTLKYIAGTQALRVHQSEGHEDRAYCTGAGKILLAYLPEDRQETFLESITFEPLALHTISDIDSLRRELHLVRKQGYAKTCDEYCDGVSAVAVPIYDPWGGVIASIESSAPTIRMKKDHRFAETLNALQLASAKIEQVWKQNIATKPKGSGNSNKGPNTTPQSA